MIRSFKGNGTEDIFHGKDSKAARKTCPKDLWRVAARKLDMINFAVALDDLRIPPNNRLEALRGERKGQFSIRINQQYRICFNWNGGYASNIEIVDYH